MYTLATLLSKFVWRTLEEDHRKCVAKRTWWGAVLRAVATICIGERSHCNRREEKILETLSRVRLSGQNDCIRWCNMMMMLDSKLDYGLVDLFIQSSRRIRIHIQVHFTFRRILFWHLEVLWLHVRRNINEHKSGYWFQDFYHPGFLFINDCPIPVFDYILKIEAFSCTLERRFHASKNKICFSQKFVIQ